MATETASSSSDFIREIVAADLRSGKHSTVVTRFPPEPNGYLHIGHAKSICLNFGVALEHGGRCHLRFDDTNPETEDPEYVEAIQQDVRWLGFDWGEHLYFASDYYPRFYDAAVELIRAGQAYICELSEEEIREYRGTVTEPGRPSPYRERTVGENLDLFARMRAGELDDGAAVLRAKIDMASPNMKMRDPLLYRIRKVDHYRTGGAWPIYPMYDFAHPLSDAYEGITHSLCTLEFENNRELYDWVVTHVTLPARPRQIEFARLALTYTVMSKRKLLQLVERRLVAGWDDPRMPTLSGLRRRGVTPEAIRAFCDAIGVAKANSTVDMSLFEHTVRDDLNHKAPRVLAVLRPLRVVIENYPEEASEELEAPFWPHDVPREGSRLLPFSRVLYIERDDFAEDPPKGFFRLAPGREVRLRYAYLVRCVGVERDPATGEVVEVRCTYDPATRGGAAPDGRKVRGTIHWLSAAHAGEATVRLYDRLFAVERPDLAEGALEDLVDPASIEILAGARIEPGLAAAGPGDRFQLERHGYFFVDPVDSRPGRPVFNRIVPLRDSWAKAARSRERTDARQERSRAAQDRGEPATASSEPVRELSREERARFDQLRAELGVGEPEARVLAQDAPAFALLGEAVEAGGAAPALANWLVHDLRRERKERAAGEDERLRFGGGELAELVALVEEGTISATVGRRVLARMVTEGGRPREIVAAHGLEQVSDRGALGPLVAEVLAAHPGEVAAFRDGKAQLLGFFVGQVMRASGGKADPRRTRELLLESLARTDG